MCVSKVQHVMGWKTGCNRSRPVFFFDKHRNWQPKKFRICPTATGGLVFCSWVQSKFGLFCSPANWTCEHYSQANYPQTKNQPLGAQKHVEVLGLRWEWLNKVEEELGGKEWSCDVCRVLVAIVLDRSEKVYAVSFFIAVTLISAADWRNLCRAFADFPLPNPIFTAHSYFKVSACMGAFTNWR